MHHSANSHPKRATRFPIAIPVRLERPAGDLRCDALNLSRSGALVTGLVDPILDSALSLTLLGTGDAEGPNLMARIARVEPVANHAYSARLGLEFLNTFGEQRLQLKRFISRVVEGQTHSDLDGLRPDARPDEARRILEQIALVRRIMLAKRGQAPARKILSWDPSPDVLDALARNPQLRRDEVLELLGRVDLGSKTLEVIAEDPRWKDHPELDLAILSHPHTHLDVALRVTQRLSPQQVARALRGPLHPALRHRIAQSVSPRLG